MLYEYWPIPSFWAPKCEYFSRYITVELVCVQQRQVSGAGVRQPPPYDSVPPHYDRPSPQPTVSPPPPPPPAPPLPPDNRQRHPQLDQTPISPLPASAAAQSGRGSPATNRPQRPPPPSERPRDERRPPGRDDARQLDNRRQRDDAYVF